MYFHKDTKLPSFGITVSLEFSFMKEKLSTRIENPPAEVAVSVSVACAAGSSCGVQDLWYLADMGACCQNLVL